jgi:hypothetical protein
MGEIKSNWAAAAGASKPPPGACKDSRLALHGGPGRPFAPDNIRFARLKAGSDRRKQGRAARSARRFRLRSRSDIKPPPMRSPAGGRKGKPSRGGPPFQGRPPKRAAARDPGAAPLLLAYLFFCQGALLKSPPPMRGAEIRGPLQFKARFPHCRSRPPDFARPIRPLSRAAPAPLMGGRPAAGGAWGLRPPLSLSLSSDQGPMEAAERRPRISSGGPDAPLFGGPGAARNRCNIHAL